MSNFHNYVNVFHRSNCIYHGKENKLCDKVLLGTDRLLYNEGEKKLYNTCIDIKMTTKIKPGVSSEIMTIAASNGLEYSVTNIVYKKWE